MDLPKKDNLDIEGFKERWALSPEQLSTTRRTEEELEIMQDFLLSIEEAFRKDITDWDLEDAFFLYQDENSEFEEDYILRMYSFSKGLTKCWLVIGCQPQIEMASENIDATLLANISNILLAQLYDLFVSD
tara:strand:+ start:74 stop:466 length:393 start_codon:yes stop_codon:yes gene_type:complete